MQRAARWHAAQHLAWCRPSSRAAPGRSPDAIHATWRAEALAIHQRVTAAGRQHTCEGTRRWVHGVGAGMLRPTHSTARLRTSGGCAAGGGRRRHGKNACAGALGRWPCRQQRAAPPVRHLMVVVLPAPLGPSRQNRRSRSIANQLPLMAQNSPRRARRRRGPPPSSRPPQQLRQPPQNRQLRELHVGRGCGRHERAG